MTAAFTESIVEETALAWLESLGYTILYSREIDSGALHVPDAEWFQKECGL